MKSQCRDQALKRNRKEKPRVLMVRHSCNWESDRCSRLLQCQGCTLDYVCPAQGDVLPDADAYAAAIIFGGVQSVNECDRYAWMRDELCWIEKFMALERPLLGICLGAQLIARGLGASVGRHPEKQEEIGFRPLYPAPGQPDFIKPGQLMFQWHNEGFELPSGAQLLARGDLFPNQAFSYAGHVTALQFHPEACHDVIQCWHTASADNRSMHDDESPKAEQLRQAKQFDGSITHWLDGFLEEWLGDRCA